MLKYIKNIVATIYKYKINFAVGTNTCEQWNKIYLLYKYNSYRYVILP